MRRMDAYDPAEDTWSRLPDLPFDSQNNRVAEVDGKLYCFAGYAGTPLDGRATFVYDPAARTWTLGPRLPGDPYSDLQAFEVEKSLCIVGLFGVDGPGSYGPGVPREATYSGFIWDRTTETWDDFPAPPIVVTHLSQKDGYIAASGNHSYDIGPEIHPSAPGERLFVMSPGSRDWAEWTFPQALGQNFSGWTYRFAAVRIG